MTEHLYRLRVTQYPPGSVEPVYLDEDAADPDFWIPVDGWAPPGWRPEGNYVAMLGTKSFIWPITSKIYRSRSTARKRATLMESLGATVVIERSHKITWPRLGANEPEHVELEVRQHVSRGEQAASLPTEGFGSLRERLERYTTPAGMERSACATESRKRTAR